MDPSELFLDIHSGGADLIFPHHSCEIAQSEHYTGIKPFVRYWFHVAMVGLAGEKMSKSLGNMLFVSELLKTYSADALRMAGCKVKVGGHVTEVLAALKA